jgi:hypothetical protein
MRIRLLLFCFTIIFADTFTYLLHLYLHRYQDHYQYQVSKGGEVSSRQVLIPEMRIRRAGRRDRSSTNQSRAGGLCPRLGTGNPAEVLTCEPNQSCIGKNRDD